MPKAAFCSQCDENVYLTEDGQCPKGHGPESLSNFYDAPETPPVDQSPVEEPATTTVPGAPAPGGPPKKSKAPLIIAIVVVVLLLCACASIGAGVWLFDQDDSGTESPLTQDEMDAVDELEEELDGSYADVQTELEAVVKYFYPTFRLEDFVEASEPGPEVDYHVIADSEQVPGFYITFFVTRNEDLSAEGADDPTFAYTGESGAVWLHPQTGPNGMAAFAGPNALVNDGMREQIMADFYEAREDLLFMTEFTFTNNVEGLTLIGITQDDLDPWYDDFTTWTSIWDNDLQNGVWVERSFESTGE